MKGKLHENSTFAENPATSTAVRSLSFSCRRSSADRQSIVDRSSIDRHGETSPFASARHLGIFFRPMWRNSHFLILCLENFFFTFADHLCGFLSSSNEKSATLQNAKFHEFKHFKQIEGKELKM